MSWVLISLVWTTFFTNADPSTAIFLRKKSEEQQQVNQPRSNRYRVVAPGEKKKARTNRDSVEIDFLEEYPDVQPEVVDQAPSVEPIKEEALEPSEVVAAPKQQSETVEQTNEKDKKLSEQVQEILLGGNLYEMIKYKQNLSNNDERKNQLELALSPMFLYADSSSDFSFYRHSHFSPGLNLDADFWLTPYVGMHINYASTSKSSFKQITEANVQVEHQMNSWGLQFRRYFSQTQGSGFLNFSLSSEEYKFRVDEEAVERTGYTYKGWGLGFEGKTDLNKGYRSTYLLNWSPSLNFSEEQTSLELKSGGSSEASGITIGLGGEFVHSRSSIVFWNLKGTHRRVNFKGEADVLDPKTGETAKNVSIDNTLIMFVFGYQWGN